MTFLSIEPFVPSGANYDKSKQLFQALGFEITWDAGDYVGLDKDGCKFILQKYDNKQFAENLMLSVKVSDVVAFWKDITDRKLSERFGISVGNPTQQPYGKEVNVIDIAGVCWHFVE
jgi:hypothetical protein